jgi:hypothetical protein
MRLSRAQKTRKSEVLSQTGGSEDTGALSLNLRVNLGKERGTKAKYQGTVLSL